MYSKQAKRKGVRKFLLVNKIQYADHEQFIREFLASYGHQVENMSFERMLDLSTIFFKSLLKHINNGNLKRSNKEGSYRSS